MSGDPAEIAARIRAVQAYAGLTHPELGKAIGLNEATVARLVSTTQSRTADRDERERIAHACGVPPAFMEEGFARYVDEKTLEQRVATLEKVIQEAEAAGLAVGFDGDDADVKPSATSEQSPSSQDPPARGGSNDSPKP